MKQFLLLIVFAVISALGFSQSQRLVLLEHFTQASCPPCATYNPGVQAILDNNPGKITAVKYQTSWPGYDPMNLHNPSDVAARVSLYNVSGVPNSVLDGNYFNGSPTAWNVGTVNARYAMSTPVEIEVQHELNSSQDTIFVTMLVKTTGPVSGNIGAYIAVIEKHIDFNFPPGSNGETDFYNVMKKLLPTRGGTKLPAQMDVGDYYIVQASWELANVYDISELGVVAWVQDRNTDEVYQSANSTTNPITPLYSHDAGVLTVTGVGGFWCSDTVNPGVVIRNQGSQSLTSAEIRYSLNGGAEQVLNWTGNLGFLEEAAIDLPQGTFTMGQSNNIKVYLGNVNSQADDYPVNDTLSRSFTPAPGTTENVYLYLKTDDKPQETTWEVLDAAGNVVYSGGPYTSAGQSIQETFTLSSGCYSFNLYDAGHDGICCSNGFGVYQLSSDINGQVLGEGDNFGREVVHAFMVNGYAGITEPEYATQPELFPNPAADEAYITFKLQRPANMELEVLDLRGKVVYRYNRSYDIPGPQQIKLSLNDLDDGLYFLNLRIGEQVELLKLNVIH